MKLRALSVVAALALAPFAQGQAVFDDFETLTGTGGGFLWIHDGSGFTEGSNNVDDGLTGVRAFAGGGGPGLMDAFAAAGTTGGVAGTGGASLVLTTLDDPSLINFVFGGIEVAAGTLNDPSAILDYVVTADIKTEIPIQLRVESPFTGTNNGFVFDVGPSGSFTTIGGPLSSATPIGSFDPAAPVNIVVATPTSNDPSVIFPLGFATSSIFTIDNVRFSIPGDLNLDGGVDANDFGIFAGNFGTAGGADFLGGDLTGDGNVDANDFGIFAGNFGKGIPAVPVSAMVPEPAGLGLLALGLAAGWRRSRRGVG